MTETDFSTLPLSPELIQVVSELGFEKLTSIQAQSIPLLLKGRDLVGQSKTGSGKTAAFALPILQKIDLSFRRPQALILAPTRELCTQVAREIRKFGRRHPGLQVLILAGGQPVRAQSSALKLGVHIVAGTPGRLLDHLRRETLDLRKASIVVLDEADRMLEMGFKDDMELILKATPTKRQTLFFSATYPSSIKAMSKLYQDNPERITVKEDSDTDITQKFYEVNEKEKPASLLWLLQKNLPESALVFCNLKATVSELTDFLLKSGVSAACLHGDLEQSDRNRVLAKFRNQSTRVLIATDVAARGLDIENLSIVFNFDMPDKTDVYVHRIGRTGRAGKVGAAMSLVLASEWYKVHHIEKTIKNKAQDEVLQLSDKSAKIKLNLAAKMETLFISAGRKDKMRPGDILGALTGEAGGLAGEAIGKIEIHDRFSYVAIIKNKAALALERLSKGRIKGRKVRVERTH